MDSFLNFMIGSKEILVWGFSGGVDNKTSTSIIRVLVVRGVLVFEIVDLKDVFVGSFHVFYLTNKSNLLWCINFKQKIEMQLFFLDKSSEVLDSQFQLRRKVISAHHNKIITSFVKFIIFKLLPRFFALLFILIGFSELPIP